MTTITNACNKSYNFLLPLEPGPPRPASRQLSPLARRPPVPVNEESKPTTRKLGTDNLDPMRFPRTNKLTSEGVSEASRFSITLDSDDRVSIIAYCKLTNLSSSAYQTSVNTELVHLPLTSQGLAKLNLQHMRLAVEGSWSWAKKYPCVVA